MFERPDAGERAVLVHLNLQVGQEDLDELKELTKSAGAQPIYVVTGSRHRPDPKYFVGKGKLDEIKAVVAEQQADIVIVNHPLSPSQERNLEKALEVRVVDRNGLILDIFAQRAQTFEGKLQVELHGLDVYDPTTGEIRSVRGTPFDFTTPRRIAVVVEADAVRLGRTT